MTFSFQCGFPFLSYVSWNVRLLHRDCQWLTNSTSTSYQRDILSSQHQTTQAFTVRVGTLNVTRNLRNENVLLQSTHLFKSAVNL